MKINQLSYCFSDYPVKFNFCQFNFSAVVSEYQLEPKEQLFNRQQGLDIVVRNLFKVSFGLTKVLSGALCGQWNSWNCDEQLKERESV